MRFVTLLAMVCALAGCAMSPPPPPKCAGEFRPINIQQKGVSTLSHEQSVALCLGGGINAKA